MYLLLLIIIYNYYVYMHVHECRCLQRSEASDPLWTGIRARCGCQNKNLGLLQKQGVLLIAKPSPQTLDIHIFKEENILSSQIN